MRAQAEITEHVHQDRRESRFRQALPDVHSPYLENIISILGLDVQTLISTPSPALRALEGTACEREAINTACIGVQ